MDYDANPRVEIGSANNSIWKFGGWLRAEVKTPSPFWKLYCGKEIPEIDDEEMIPETPLYSNVESNLGEEGTTGQHNLSLAVITPRLGNMAPLVYTLKWRPNKFSRKWAIKKNKEILSLTSMRLSRNIH
ncbi:uncharacterized protein J3R85_004434 [Psidium guajava]|nr:uncharacterized protein J3R85_004434 [Psidium guajava]